VKAPRENIPEVVYTNPKPFRRGKFLVRLFTVFAVVLALMLAVSIFFKVDTVTVAGAEKYTPWMVREASGIQKGEGLLTLGKAKACGRITEALPYVKIVRIGITLPGTVKIYVEELNVVYSVQDSTENWWMVTADGRVVEPTSVDKAQKTTTIKGVKLYNPVVGAQAKALEAPVEDVGGEQKPVTITNQDRLDTALSIMTELESRGILGEVASLDVEDMGHIELWYGDDYQVKLGDSSQMDKKIALMCGTIQHHEKEGSYRNGILDITFEIYPGAVGYEAFK
jgi:cell division protein FtsQ